MKDERRENVNEWYERILANEWKERMHHRRQWRIWSTDKQGKRDAMPGAFGNDRSIIHDTKRHRRTSKFTKRTDWTNEQRVNGIQLANLAGNGLTFHQAGQREATEIGGCQCAATRRLCVPPSMHSVLTIHRENSKKANPRHGPRVRLYPATATVAYCEAELNKAKY